MDNDFKELMLENLHEIKTQLKEVNEKLNESQIKNPTLYATKQDLQNTQTSNSDAHKTIIGWLLGVYGMLLTVVIFLVKK